MGKVAACGTTGGYMQHRYKGTEQCADCLRAWREYHAKYKAARAAGKLDEFRQRVPRGSGSIARLPAAQLSPEQLERRREQNRQASRRKNGTQRCRQCMEQWPIRGGKYCESCSAERRSTPRRRVKPCPQCGNEMWSNAKLCKGCAGPRSTPWATHLEWYACPCGAPMVKRVGTKWCRKYCSDRCRLDQISDRVMGLYHLATAHADVVVASRWRQDAVAILRRRDGDKCGICNRKMKFDVPTGPKGDKLGATIDHVIPRSQGGGDEWSNLRLAHWQCNHQRGNRGGGEQLKLVG